MTGLDIPQPNSEEVGPEINVQSSSAMCRKAVSHSILIPGLKPQVIQILLICLRLLYFLVTPHKSEAPPRHH